MHIHHEVTGTGPAVLLTHGFGASSHMFASTVAAIAAAGHTAIVWDMPGHGRSDAPDDSSQYSTASFLNAMTAILDEAGADQAVLLGHSLGGFLSLELALAHPERVAALALVDTGPGFRNDAARAGWNDMAESYARNLETKGLAGLPGSTEMIGGIHSTAVGLAITARNVLQQHDGHVIDGLPTITVLTLVVVGERDKPFVGGSHYMATKIPNATLAVIEGCGHTPPISHPDEFNVVLADFLKGLPA